MTVSNPPGDSSIFDDGKLKPGTYKIQNLYSQTYLDIHEHSRETCCRPVGDLENGRGLWEIRPLGAGYSVRMVGPGRPDQFCAPLEGISDGTSIFVGAYPAAWRIEVVDDDKHRGFEYIRIFWGTTKSAWDLDYGRGENGTRMHFWVDTEPVAWRIWKLVPVKMDDVFKSSQPPSEVGSLPSYDEGTTGQSSTHVQRVESENDEFGTIVNEVTVVTTVTNSTITTRKRYRVGDV